MNLLALQSSPTFGHLIPLWSKHSPQRPALGHLLSMYSVHDIYRRPLVFHTDSFPLDSSPDMPFGGVGGVRNTTEISVKMAGVRVEVTDSRERCNEPSDPTQDTGLLSYMSSF
jgi:hypothetical protein